MFIEKKNMQKEKLQGYKSPKNPILIYDNS
jgi:hypothetical protein